MRNLIIIVVAIVVAVAAIVMVSEEAMAAHIQPIKGCVVNDLVFDQAIGDVVMAEIAQPCPQKGLYGDKVPSNLYRPFGKAVIDRH